MIINTYDNNGLSQNNSERDLELVNVTAKFVYEIYKKAKVIITFVCSLVCIFSAYLASDHEFNDIT